MHPRYTKQIESDCIFKEFALHQRNNALSEFKYNGRPFALEHQQLAENSQKYQRTRHKTSNEGTKTSRHGGVQTELDPRIFSFLPRDGSEQNTVVTGTVAQTPHGNHNHLKPKVME
jgi:hypothetical protein